MVGEIVNPKYDYVMNDYVIGFLSCTDRSKIHWVFPAPISTFNSLVTSLFLMNCIFNLSSLGLFTQAPFCFICSALLKSFPVKM